MGKLLRIKIILVIGIFLVFGSIGHGDGQNRNSGPRSRSWRCFFYTAKKFGVPILKASIRIGNGSLERGKPSWQVDAHVDSLDYLGFLFRMNNRFTTIMEAETYAPIRYVKEINQGGLLIQRKNYFQTLVFDSNHRRVVVQKGGEGKEVLLPPDTYDPLSMFARCYLKEEFYPGQDIQMSLYDGVKFRQMVFHVEKEKVSSHMYGEVEAVRLESTTPLSSFGDREGIIRIWYTMDEEKTPILIELDLPIGSVRFDLEEVRGG